MGAIKIIYEIVKMLTNLNWPKDQGRGAVAWTSRVRTRGGQRGAAFCCYLSVYMYDSMMNQKVTLL